LLQRAACNWVVGPVAIHRELAQFQKVLRQSPTNAVALRYTQALRSPPPAQEPQPGSQPHPTSLAGSRKPLINREIWHESRRSFS
jgi:hypothetical protein